MVVTPGAAIKTRKCLQVKVFGVAIDAPLTSRRVINCTAVRNLQRGLERLTGMDEFDRYRAEMNEKLLGSGHLGIKRFFALDTQAYEDGALDQKTKELMGLAASIVLRCDDCITYHIKQCATVGVTREQFMDAFNVALVVGGSITIPHLRRATDKLDQIL
jgi:AhpD family alkylhydroperoxidase